MGAKAGKPMVPCAKCGKHYASDVASCPHCGAPAVAVTPAQGRRRAFIYAAISAGAAAGIVTAFGKQFLNLFKRRTQTLYGAASVTGAESIDASVFTGIRQGGLNEAPATPPPARTPEELASDDRALARARDLHRAGKYEEAVQAYDQALIHAPPEEHAKQIMADRAAAQAHRPLSH